MGPWISTLVPTHSTKYFYRLNQDVEYSIPFVSRYFTCPRFECRYHHSPFNLVTGKYSLLVPQCHILCDQLLNHVLASDQECALPRGPRAYLSISRRNNIPLWYMTSNEYLPKYLRDIFMIILLRCDGWSPQSILPILGSDIILRSKDTEHLTYN